MRFLVAAVGKPRDPALAGAIHEYERRAARYWPLEVIEVREEGARRLAPERVVEREGERLLGQIGSARIVACDEGGTSLDSRAFAAWMQQAREDAVDLAFLIGGAYGLSQAIRSRAVRRLALAPWTMAHELARLVLAEQLYRAGTIVRGEPYHK